MTFAEHKFPQVTCSGLSEPDTRRHVSQESSEQRDIDAGRCESNQRVEHTTVLTRH